MADQNDENKMGKRLIFFGFSIITGVFYYLDSLLNEQELVQYSARPRGVYVRLQIMFCHNAFGQMIICYNTGTYVTQYQPIQCSLSCICIGLISVCRCLLKTLDGYVYTQWRLKVKHKKPYPLCFSMNAHQHLWLWAVQRSRYWESFTRGLLMPTVSQTKGSVLSLAECWEKRDQRAEERLGT